MESYTFVVEPVNNMFFFLLLVSRKTCVSVILPSYMVNIAVILTMTKTWG